MSKSYLQSERSTHGLETDPVLFLVPVPVPVGGSGGRPGVSSRPRRPPYCRAASRLLGYSRAELRRCQVTRIRLLLVSEGIEVWVYSLLRFQHTFRSELDFLLYTLYISSPAAGDLKRLEGQSTRHHTDDITEIIRGPLEVQVHQGKSRTGHLSSSCSHKS